MLPQYTMVLPLQLVFHQEDKIHYVESISTKITNIMVKFKKNNWTKKLLYKTILKNVLVFGLQII